MHSLIAEKDDAGRDEEEKTDGIARHCHVVQGAELLQHVTDNACYITDVTMIDLDDLTSLFTAG